MNDKEVSSGDELVEGPVAEDVDSLKRAVDEEKAKAEGYLASWQRAQADFVNYKRRAEQERSDAVRYGNAALILSLLPVLDDLERALGNIPGELAGDSWVDGIRLIYGKFKAALEEQGVSEIKALGEPFDPHSHEAVLSADGEEGMVVEEMQKGYMLHDRLLRPTRVVVGKGRGAESEDNQEGDNG